MREPEQIARAAMDDLLRAAGWQVCGRGVRVISPDDLKGVTPDANAKDHFVIVDCVDVCERDMTNCRPMPSEESAAACRSSGYGRIAAHESVGPAKHSRLANDAIPSREFDFMLSNPPTAKAGIATWGA